jgi:hypothetical protein
MTREREEAKLFLPRSTPPSLVRLAHNPPNHLICQLFISPRLFHRMRLGKEVLEWFRKQVHETGGRNYQTLINAALGEHISARTEPLGTVIRRVIPEELKRAS